MASTEFKTAIKSDVREIKGYCTFDYVPIEINLTTFYNDYSEEAIISAAVPNRKTSFSDIFNVKNYASFEHEYFKTDGSMILANNPSIYLDTTAGYITDEIMSSNKYYEISNVTSNSLNNGISYYFSNDYPIAGYYTVGILNDAITTYYDYYFTNNEKFYLLFNDYLEHTGTCVSIRLTITELSNPEHRLRINAIRNGMIALFQDNELLNMTINEETDINNETIPTSDCSIILNNYDNKFDILDNESYAKYLISGIDIKPYIGCVIENGTIEYEKMGIYKLKNWTNNSDSTTTINTENVLSTLSNFENFAYRGESFEEFFNYVGIDANITTTFNYGVAGQFAQNITAVQYLQLMLIANNSYLYIDRDGIPCVAVIDTTVNDSYSLSNFKDYPKVENNTKVGKVIVNCKSASNFSETLTEVINTTVTHDASGTTKYFTYWENPYFIGLNNDDTNINITGGTLVSTQYGYNSIEVVVNATEDFNLTVSGKLINTIINNSYVSVDETINNGQTLTVDLYSDGFSVPGVNIGQGIANNILNNYKNYTITTSGQQDPSIIVGSLIGVETKYGYKNILVNKNNFVYDGGLHGNVEGVGD